MAYGIGGEALSRPDVIVDLGVTFSSHLNFDHHIYQMVNDAYRKLGFVLRNSKLFKDIDAVKLLYFAFVRSRLEYACVVWSPYHNNYIRSIEVIQNRFLRFLYFIKNGNLCPNDFSTAELRSIFGIESLKVRRDYFSLVTLYRIIKNDTDSPCLFNRFSWYVPSLRRNRGLEFFVPRSNTINHYNSPLNVMRRSFNRISGHIDIFFDTLFQLRAKTRGFLML